MSIHDSYFTDFDLTSPTSFFSDWDANMGYGNSVEVYGVSAGGSTSGYFGWAAWDNEGSDPFDEPLSIEDFTHIGNGGMAVAKLN